MSSKELTVLPAGYAGFLADVKARIRAAQARAAFSVNRELIALYWYMGKGIVERQKRLGWGAGVIERLSLDLRRAFSDMEGFSTRNIWRMRAFYVAYAGFVQKLPQAVAEFRRMYKFKAQQRVSDFGSFERASVGWGFRRIRTGRSRSLRNSSNW